MSMQKERIDKKAYKNGSIGPCCCSKVVVSLLCTILLFSSVLAFIFLLIYDHSDSSRQIFDEQVGEEKKRFRRQTLPSDNVRVYATNSNISVTDKIQVLSAESRIQLVESHLNATIWSNGSLLQMSPDGQEVALSASQAIALTMAMVGGARVEGSGDSIQVNERSRPEEETSSSTDWYSRMETELAGRAVNLSWSNADGAIALRALGARSAALVSLGWERAGQEEELSVLSAPAITENGTERELGIVANSAAYQVQIRLVGGLTALQFRGAHLDIPPSHRSLLLRWQSWRIQVQSFGSPFEVRATSRELRISCYAGALTLRLEANSIGLDVGQLSRLLINRSSSSPSSRSSSIRINGAQISSRAGSATPDLAELLSRQLHLSLNRDPQLGQSVLADSRHSQLKLAHSNRTSATLTAIRHVVEMLGGQPSLELLTGNVSVQMSADVGGADEGQRLETDILPKELVSTGDNEDIFGIGPIAPIEWPSPTSSRPTTTSFPSRSSSSLSSPHSSPSPSSSPSSSSPFPSFPILPGPTPLMARPDQLFTFHQSFPPPIATPSAATPSPTSIPSQSAQIDAFPSPQPHLFTFAPSDANFFVGYFEAAQTSQRPEARIPISATISSLQMPQEEGEELVESEDFPGIRRENRQSIWRPPEEEESGKERRRGEGEEGKQSRKAREFKMEGEKEGEEEKGGRRRGGEEGSGDGELILALVLGQEEDLHEGRLRDDLARGMEEMLNGKEEGRERRRGEAAEEEAAGGRQFRVRKVQLERMEGAKEEEGQVGVHFWVEGAKEAVERLNALGPAEMAKAMAGHQLVSAPRLLPSPPSSSSPPPPPPPPPPMVVARSPALLAISAHSLPVLPIGLLTFAISLLAMLIGLRPSAKAFQRVQQWMRLRRNGAELPS